MRESVLERLTNVHPHLEVWWDSSPLVFQSWLKKMLDHAPAARRATLEEQLSRIYVIGDPASSLVRGCTTTPASLFDRRKERPEILE
jgi:transaldolase